MSDSLAILHICITTILTSGLRTRTRTRPRTRTRTRTRTPSRRLLRLTRTSVPTSAPAVSSTSAPGSSSHQPGHFRCRAQRKWWWAETLNSSHLYIYYILPIEIYHHLTRRRIPHLARHHRRWDVGSNNGNLRPVKISYFYSAHTFTFTTIIECTVLWLVNTILWVVTLNYQISGYFSTEE